MKKRLSYGLILIALLGTLATTGCGWQVRDALATSHLNSLYVNGNDAATFIAQMKRSLRGQGVEFKAQPDDAQYQIHIAEQRSERRTASVSSSARATEYLLIESLKFQVMDARGMPLVPLTRLSSERTFEFDEQQVLGKNDESNLIQTELRRELIRQLVDHLQHLPSSAG